MMVKHVVGLCCRFFVKAVSALWRRCSTHASLPACNPLCSSPLDALARLLNARQAAGLEVVAEVMDSQCLLIVGKDTKHREMVDLIVRRIEGYITAEK